MELCIHYIDIWDESEKSIPKRPRNAYFENLHITTHGHAFKPGLFHSHNTFINASIHSSLHFELNNIIIELYSYWLLFSKPTQQKQIRNAINAASFPPRQPAGAGRRLSSRVADGSAGQVRSGQPMVTPLASIVPAIANSSFTSKMSPETDRRHAVNAHIIWTASMYSHLSLMVRHRYCKNMAYNYCRRGASKLDSNLHKGLTWDRRNIPVFRHRFWDSDVLRGNRLLLLRI